MITGDSQDFMSWFLNALHSALNGTKKLSSSVINKTFRGKMKVYSKKVPPLEMVRCFLSHDIASGSDVRPCNKIDKPQVVYRFW